MGQTALVHSIESCGVFDGPGIRTVIFLQGCKLRCLYCHNPDTWSLKGNQEMSIPQLLEKVRSFQTFLTASKGGVTVSGGEPLLQKKFLVEFFTVLKSEGIHTCIDTNGMVHMDDVTLRLMELTDMFLLDIKCLDPDEHKKLTGKSNTLPLAFLDELEKRQKRVWVRHVVVPNYTDSLKKAEQLSHYLSKYSCIEQIDLLPFHKMGEYKFEELNLKYHLKDTQPPSEERMTELKKIFCDQGLKTS